jgi:hypothetical protein
MTGSLPISVSVVKRTHERSIELLVTAPLVGGANYNGVLSVVMLVTGEYGP